MQIEYLHYLVEIAKIGSFSQAAESLYMSQQRLSEIVSKIEKDFNIKIFVRSKKGLSLTPDGKRFLKDVEPIVQQYEYLNKVYKLSHENKDSLKIVINQIVSDLFFENVIEVFHKEHPNKLLSITERENPLAILQDISDMKADLAITSLPPSIFREKHTFTNLIFEDLFIDQLCCLIPKDHPFAEKTRLTLAEILTQPLILDTNNLIHDFFLDYYIRKNHLNPNYNVVMSGNGHTNLKMVSHHLGVSFIFKFQVRKLHSNDLIALPILDIDPFHFVIVMSNKVQPSMLLQSFIRTYIEIIQKCSIEL